MKISNLSEEIAQACGARRQVVTSIVTETFRQIQEAVGKGERVSVPDFGVFMGRNEAKDGVAGKPGIRFRAVRDEAEKAARKSGKGEKASDAPKGDDDEGDDD